MKVWLLALILLQGCAPANRSIKHPPIGPHQNGIAWDLRASEPQVQKGNAYIVRYLNHWDEVRHVSVVIVQDGSLFVDGVAQRGARDLDRGIAYASYGPSGEVYSIEWEVPLCTQGVQDPTTWTWGPAGPLYPNQEQRFIDLTNQPLR